MELGGCLNLLLDLWLLNDVSGRFQYVLFLWELRVRKHFQVLHVFSAQWRLERWLKCWPLLRALLPLRTLSSLWPTLLFVQHEKLVYRLRISSLRTVWFVSLLPSSLLICCSCLHAFELVDWEKRSVWFCSLVRGHFVLDADLISVFVLASLVEGTLISKTSELRRKRVLDHSTALWFLRIVNRVLFLAPCSFPYWSPEIFESHLVFEGISPVIWIIKCADRHWPVLSHGSLRFLSSVTFLDRSWAKRGNFTSHSQLGDRSPMRGLKGKVHWLYHLLS